MRALRNAAPSAALALLLGSVLSSCIVVPPQLRDWQTVVTPHFEVFAAYEFGGIPRLGLELEQFRATAEHLWGRPFPSPARRILVVAYDGSGSVQPFQQPKRESSYLLARPAGETIVFRSPYGWSEAAPTGLRLELARRLFRNAGEGDAPPWLVEGLAQLASSSDVRGGRQVRLGEILFFPLLPLALLEVATDEPNRVEVGHPREELLERLHRRTWVPLERVTGAEDLEGWSQRDREMFEAESWLLVHYLKLGPQYPDSPQDPIESLRRSLERGSDAGAALRAATGQGLEKDLVRYARRSSFDGLELGVDAVSVATPVEVPRNTIRDRLGQLALDLDQSHLAQLYFQDALEEEPDAAPLRAGFCAARAQKGQRDASCDEALEAAPEDALVLRRTADAKRSLAGVESSPEPRRELAREATELYERALAERENDPALLYGLAAVRLESGDAAGALEALARLHRWLPGDPEVQQLTARAELARGERRAARRWATRAITTARNDAEIATAQSVLEQIDAQVARH